MQNVRIFCLCSHMGEVRAIVKRVIYLQDTKKQRSFVEGEIILKVVWQQKDLMIYKDVKANVLKMVFPTKWL